MSIEEKITDAVDKRIEEILDPLDLESIVDQAIEEFLEKELN